MVDHKLLRLSATLLFIGQVVGFVFVFLYPSLGDVATDQTMFAIYAA
jgi:hypothetical protein